MLDLAKHIVEQKSGHFEPEKFEDHYEVRACRVASTRSRRDSRSPRQRRQRPANVVNLMDALPRASLKSPEKTASGRNRKGPG